MTAGATARAGRGLSSEVRARIWRWARLAGGLAILALLVVRLGATPFVDGLREVDARSLLAALAITAVTTVVSAWRWRLIARGLGLPIPLGRAVAAYYRSQFLNSVLPGGVLGDVHRGVRQGEEGHDVSAGLRSVAWDRAAGQVVQVALAVVVLLVFPSPVRTALAVTAGAITAVLLVFAVVVLLMPSRGRSWPVRFARTARADVRASLPTRRVGVAVFAASSVVVAGHAAVFLVAARTEGTTASLSTMVPIAMLVLLAMTVPTSVGGWGPREGVAAWAFSMAGLGAAQGVATATVYGVLSLVATLPGAAVLVRRWWLRRAARAAATIDRPEPARTLVVIGRSGAWLTGPTPW